MIVQPPSEGRKEVPIGSRNLFKCFQIGKVGQLLFFKAVIQQIIILETCRMHVTLAISGYHPI